ncbi:hypothetical protein DAMDJJ_09165 [Cupriavidus necator]
MRPSGAPTRVYGRKVLPASQDSAWSVAPLPRQAASHEPRSCPACWETHSRDACAPGSGTDDSSRQGRHAAPSRSPAGHCLPPHVGYASHKRDPEHIGHRRRGQRHARVAAVGVLHGVHRQEAQGVDAKLIQRGGRKTKGSHRVHSGSPEIGSHMTRWRRKQGAKNVVVCSAGGNCGVIRSKRVERLLPGPSPRPDGRVLGNAGLSSSVPMQAADGSSALHLTGFLSLSPPVPHSGGSSARRHQPIQMGPPLQAPVPRGIVPACFP